MLSGVCALSACPMDRLSTTDGFQPRGPYFLLKYSMPSGHSGRTLVRQVDARALAQSELHAAGEQVRQLDPEAELIEVHVT